MFRTLRLTAFLTVALFGVVSALVSGDAAAQMQPRPQIKGRTYKLKVDSSPQQAAVYWDAGDTDAEEVRHRRLHADDDQGPQGDR